MIVLYYTIPDECPLNPFGLLSAIEEREMSEPPSTNKYSQFDTGMNTEHLSRTIRRYA
jgi:hypothetical protein